ncbi:MAG TPA: TIM barrel protein [Dinghuibacter sp.]|uniref:TIM barrel protein n=1 Tax=Dinghuibacter sp. TaxID=2024697 RepID=UPI002C8FC11F|nr:TIM barrel protein [Dinghuibacter sp.]HTJ14696.1 TIM barrel protein [Dinghuibacter sp.]
MRLSRKRFLHDVGVTLAGVAVLPQGAARKGRTGLQLYSVRDEMNRDAPGTLLQLANMGYRRLEHAGYWKRKFYGRTAKEFRDLLDGLGLTLLSGHVFIGPEHWQDGHFTDEWRYTVEDAAAAGQHYLVTPSIADDWRKDYDALVRHLDVFNQCGAYCKKWGLTFGYHNHSMEFNNRLDNMTVYDIILQKTDPSLVAQQMDIGNMYAAGQDPRDILKKYPGRYPLLHVRDVIKSPGAGERNTGYDSTVLGEGIMPVKAILSKALAMGGTTDFIIEQESFQDRPELTCARADLSFMNRLGFLIAMLLFLVTGAGAQDIVQRNLLHRYSLDKLQSVLIRHDQWHPFPRTAAEWAERVPDSIRRWVVEEGEKHLRDTFAPIPATLYLDFQRTGNRTRFEDVSFNKRAQLFSLVLAEAMEQKGRFTDEIMDGLWSICEETFWGDPAHYYLQKAGIGLPDVEDPSVDIFSSETAEILALTDYLIGPELEKISPLLRRRIYYEVNRRVLAPLERDSVAYSYLGAGHADAPVNNWNAWVISNWMISLLLLEHDDNRRAKELQHGMDLLDNYINGLGEDGAVDEGPSYWFGGAGRLFDALTLLSNATHGEVSVYDAPVIRRVGEYIEKVHIAGDYFVNIADASPTISADGLLIYRVGRDLKDDNLERFGAWVYHHIDDHKFYSKDWSKPRVVWNLLALTDCQRLDPPLPAVGDVWMGNYQLLTVRASPSADGVPGLFLATHAGHNGESHNHNDVGDVMVYSEGQPVIIDVGFGTYNQKTFSKDRYDLWYLNSAHHNVPLVNGYQQPAGRRYTATDVRFNGSADKPALQMDIARAYPGDAGIRSWNRTVSLDKKSLTVSIHDDFALSGRKGPLTQTFMTVCAVDLDKPGKIVFTIPGHRSVVLEYDTSAWSVSKETMETSQPDEKRIADNWSNRPIYRLLLTNRGSGTTGRFIYTIKQQ